MGWAYVSHLLGEKRCKGVVKGRKGSGRGRQTLTLKSKSKWEPDWEGKVRGGGGGC